ncbi:hypothetical protein AQUCO_03000085v1 [Aquilegia coerulea]|uniref:Uncharacterized protein n=1 Tax=Aquilegia coerulea TaxID=218851 RepID=A0A2G5D158_AQUCA|nr:hypothetical protein AQUCO_03000085v1 [Aquilegia coerulea]
MAAKSRNTIVRKKSGIVNLKIVVEKLQRSLSLARRPHSNYNDTAEHEFEEIGVPEDVKEGHFAVIAINNGQPKRYVVALNYLTHPAFRKLLEQAAEEYGFDHEGALTIPCRSSELESILAQQWKDQRTDIYANIVWDSCQTMVKSC